MIFGLDHVTWGGTITDARRDFLRGLGYQPVLSAQRLGNLEIKRPWLHAFSPEHALELSRVSNGVGVEMVDHGATHGITDRFLPVLHGAEPLDSSDRPLDATPRGPAFWSSSLALAYVLEAGDPQPIRSFVWRSSQPEASARFWRRFGFAVDSINPRHLRFRGVDGVGCDMTLAPVAQAEPTRLDAAGLTCLAFVSTSVARDLADLAADGVVVSAIASITPGQHALDIGFAEGPDGEVVELIGTAK